MSFNNKNILEIVVTIFILIEKSKETKIDNTFFYVIKQIILLNYHKIVKIYLLTTNLVVKSSRMIYKFV
jgi:hypothetical protein